MSRLHLRLSEHTAFLLILLVAAFAIFPESVYAASGEDIFQKAARAIVDKILPGSFGAIVAVIAGVLALVAAATGSYRGAWALLFVTLASVLTANLVRVFFNIG